MLRSASVVFVLLLFLERPASAYLDPGTGSMLLQALLGGVAAVGVIARLYWHRHDGCPPENPASQTLNAASRRRGYRWPVIGSSTSR